MFSKSILRALAIDGGVGLDNPTQLVDLLEEFAQKSEDIQIVQTTSLGALALGALAGLSGGAAIPLLLVSGALVGGALGATLKHRLTAADQRELALLQRHRSLIHTLGGIAKDKGTESTLTRYEELISTYSQLEDCFYCERTKISAHQVALLLEGAILPNAPSLPAPGSSAPSKRFSLAQLAKPTRTVPSPGNPALPEEALASTPPETPTSSSPQSWDADVPAEEASIASQPWDTDTDESAQWMQDLLHYPAVLIYGLQGSGKTTLATWMIHQRQQLGHQVEILDPHREYGQWEGFSVYGDGMDYEAIDQRLVAYSKLIVSRYKQRAQQPTFNPRPLTYLVEEFTQWHRKCRYSSAFFESSLSDTRKINMGVIFVSHGRTLVTLGGAKGLAETRDNSLLEIELFAQVDPTTKKHVRLEKDGLNIQGCNRLKSSFPIYQLTH
jgi:hypothetical protein